MFHQFFIRTNLMGKAVCSLFLLFNLEVFGAEQIFSEVSQIENEAVKIVELLKGANNEKEWEEALNVLTEIIVEITQGNRDYSTNKFYEKLLEVGLDRNGSLGVLDNPYEKVAIIFAELRNWAKLKEQFWNQRKNQVNFGVYKSPWKLFWFHLEKELMALMPEYSMREELSSAIGDKVWRKIENEEVCDCIQNYCRFEDYSRSDSLMDQLTTINQLFANTIRYSSSWKNFIKEQGDEVKRIIPDEEKVTKILEKAKEILGKSIIPEEHSEVIQRQIDIIFNTGR